MSQVKAQDSKRFLLYAVPAVIVFTALYLIRGTTFEDDAYIYYRYAKNWAEGYGLVYNIGEYVEGYSNLLWVAILAAAAFFSFELANFVPLLNLFIGIICLFLISYISSFIQFSKPRLMAVILPLFCALSYSFYYYSAAGMDTLLSSLILLLWIISLYKSKNTGKYLTTFILLFLMIIVRTEGFIYVIVGLSILTYFVFMEYKKLPKQLFVTILASAVLIALMFIVRYSVYNAWMSNPIIAKGYTTHLFKSAIVNGDLGRIKEFVIIILGGLSYHDFFFFLGAWIPFVVLLWNKNKTNCNMLLYLIASSIAVDVFFSVWAGGDYMPLTRRFVPVLPITIIFVAWAADLLFCRYWGGSLYKKAAMFVLGIFMMILWLGYFTKPAMFTKAYLLYVERTSYLREIGNILHDIPVPTTVLSQMQGIMSYYAGPHVYIRDILGITNMHNAKYGDGWGFNWGMGGCGRTDYNYSFTTPFDMFFYNSINMDKKFISFCEKNPSICIKYRFLKSAKWPDSYFYIVVNINHPVYDILREKYGAEAFPIN